MKTLNQSSLTPLIFEQALRAKDAYRKDAGALTWEEKVAAIERMRDTFAEARKSMAQARHQNQSRQPATLNSK